MSSQKLFNPLKNRHQEFVTPTDVICYTLVTNREDPAFQNFHNCPFREQNMIETIDIEKFGTYERYKWGEHVLDNQKKTTSFRKLNILYGRNYAGKTTLSRIIQSLEFGELPKKYERSQFSIKISGSTITQNNLKEAPLQVRVFNKDFVDRNLSFLRADDGSIQTFAVLGERNTELLDAIQQLENEIGNVEEKRGFRFEFTVQKNTTDRLRASHDQLKSQLEQKLVDKANKKPNGIKHNSKYRDPNYDIKKLKVDVGTATAGAYEPLTDATTERYTAILSEKAMPDLKATTHFTFHKNDLFDQVTQQISKEIRPSKAIDELLANSTLQAWVKAGIDHHRGMRDTCAFCTSALSSNLWERLDAHFDKESQKLEKSLSETLQAVEIERNRLKSHCNFLIENFYPSLSKDAAARLIYCADKKNIVLEELNKITNALIERRSNIFEPFSLEINIDCLNEYNAAVNDLSELIAKHNSKTSSIEKDQKEARESLRINEISRFLVDIGYDECLKKIDTAKNELEISERELLRITRVGQEKAKKLADLKMELRDEKKGAQKVNEYLHQHFGNQSIRLEAIETAISSYQFKVMRGDDVAHNLSEGECSLVAFCYFLAKLDDVSAHGKSLVIYIDDPISSLDSNHIFFIYGLIDRVLAKPITDALGKVCKDANGKTQYRFHQLFISTHNLEFLKYLKRLSVEGKEKESFIIHRRGQSSAIELMPSHLRNYITELNYLFSEVCICSNSENIKTHYQCFYSFGNNLRKFLEGYLFFKFPSDTIEYDQRIKIFFGDNSAAEPIIQRLTNELSHLGEFFDRGTVPIDSAEISTMAMYILGKLKAADAKQYECFLQSARTTDPLIG